MASSYDHKKIEQTWRSAWDKAKLTETDLTNSKDSYYCLSQFPYPSGDGLHAGHWRPYVLSDVYARYQRLHGKNVLYPMGFDSFGLPAENAAIKTGSHPKDFTDAAVERFRTQLNQIGCLFDWSKEVRTDSPEYYRWTQWLFLQLLKHGYAEKRLAEVNWCPKDQTVLANEQVINGQCERCGTQVEKKELSQWFVKTTKLASQLLKGLDEVEWPERVKTLQRNWIGRSEGAKVIFDSSAGPIEVFTTRVDTIFGVNALVLAPEHPLVEKLTTASQKAAVEKFIASAKSKTNIDREQAELEAIDIGATATHPLTKKKIPIWLAEYVLTSYGTGAVMSVPAHDERDYRLAKKYNLPILPVIETEESTDVEETMNTKLGLLINSGELNGLSIKEAVSKLLVDYPEAITKQTTYRLRDWLVSRQRYWGAPIPIVYDPEGTAHPIKDEHLPLELPTDVDLTNTAESPLATSKEYIERAEKLYGQGWRFDTDTLDTFVDSSWYFYRYLSPTDQGQAFDPKFAKAWLPVDLYFSGIEHATLHLLYARFVHRFLVAEKYLDEAAGAEPFKQLFNFGLIHKDGAKMSKSRGNVVNPDELVEHYGTDALRGYEMFMGPLEQEAEWSTSGINGIHRFLIKLHKLATTLSKSAKENRASAAEFNNYLQIIEPMYADFRLNTVIAEAMKLVNVWHRSGVNLELLRDFAVTLSPIFPFLAEELYKELGGQGLVAQASWPKVSSKLVAATQISVRLNHKHQAMIDLDADADQKEAEAAAWQQVERLRTFQAERVIYKAGQFIDFC